MTYMDELIFETKWHTSPAVTNIQNYIRQWMGDFQGTTFLDWSRNNNFPISEKLHPLEPAHKAAAKLILAMLRDEIDKTRPDKIQTFLNKY